MIGLVQRVSSASVTIDGTQTAQISRGVLALIGIEKADTETTATRLLEKILGYRMFADAQGRMNLDVQQIKGGLLLVPQFTLVADTSRGLRPGFSAGAQPAQAQALFSQLVDQARLRYALIGAGTFGADMQVELSNDGPVTFWLRIEPD